MNINEYALEKIVDNQQQKIRKELESSERITILFNHGVEPISIIYEA